VDRIVVTGLWHLGCVTAACLAQHYDVVGHDHDRRTVDDLNAGVPPLFEPGLAELIAAGISAERLRFTTRAADIGSAHTLWVAFDTPVDEEDRADVEFIAGAISGWLPFLAPGTLVIISSQIPVGFTARMEGEARRDGLDLSFAYLPENLRLGQALDVFRRPDRVVAGVRNDADRDRIARLLQPFTESVVWMSVESAEMAKHALNAFLATSITFANEIAAICERVGADFKDVERALRSESRIGPRAYLAAGLGFAGGTLARDVRALKAIGEERQVSTDVLDGVLKTNARQQRWAASTLLRELGELQDKKIAVLGLTYKPGTDTLRRSSVVELCRRVHAEGARIIAFDPAVHHLGEEAAFIDLVDTPELALAGADALVVGTEWPEFLTLSPSSLDSMRRRLVIDPKRWLEDRLHEDGTISYFGVGLSAAATSR
jgi:UDPglucose 6-dehydrogenase